MVKLNIKNYEKLIQQNKIKSMSSDDIFKYFKNMPIILYNTLDKYNSIDDLLPRDNSFFMLLYQNVGEHQGHWTTLIKKNNKIFFFDSYGLKPDDELKWNTKEHLLRMKIYKPYLSILLEKSKLPVFYNDIQYQKYNGKGEDISTCGRHCVFFLLNVIEKNRDLHGYYNFMNYAKKTLKEKCFDNVVSEMIFE